jgi:hypothetical protein
MPLNLDITQPLPFAEGYFDAVFCMNSLSFYGGSTELASKGILQDPHISPPRVLLLQECEGLLAAVFAGEDLRCALEDAR